ncbi:hypothetical protein ACFLRF_02990 [Candidatus Altiarchaeota archaeon]
MRGVRLLSLLSILLAASGCINPEEPGAVANTSGMDQNSTDDGDFIISGLFVPVLQKEEIILINDFLDRKNYLNAVHKRIEGVFNDSSLKPIHSSNNQHLDEVNSLLELYYFPRKKNPYTPGGLELYTLHETCVAGFEAEMNISKTIENIIPKLHKQEIRQLFKQINNDTVTIHKPAFHACVARQTGLE